MAVSIVMTILFILSLSINLLVLAVWRYKKRKTKGENAKVSEFEIEGNPCYEATEVKQMGDNETHLYEMVQEKRGKQ